MKLSCALTWRWLIAGGLMFMSASTLLAQQAARNPRIGYVYPAGAQRAATTQIVVGGQFLDDASSVSLSGSGIKATVKEQQKPMPQQQVNKLRQTVRELTELRDAALAYPKLSAASRPSTRPVFTDQDGELLKEARAKLAAAVIRPANPGLAEQVTLEITVAADAPPGRRELRLQTAGGLTNPVVFCVGDLPEIADVPAKVREQATVSVPGRQKNVTLPILLNGQIEPGGVDRYQFSARRGQSIVAVASARSLMPYLADAVPGWFQATLTLYDSLGHELIADDDSRVDHDPLLHFVIPSDGQYVIEIKDALYRGRDDFVYRLAIGEIPFVTGIFPLGGPAKAQPTVELLGWNLPLKQFNDDCRTAVAGICSLALPPQLSLSRLSFAVDDLPECLAQKPVPGQSTPQVVNPPIIINGRLTTQGQCDVFQFTGHAGQRIVAEVLARRLGSPLDSLLEVTDSAGKQVAINDDFDDKACGLVTHQADSYIPTTLPSDGSYLVKLRDVQGQCGNDYAYRLRISQPRPDYQVFAEPSSITVHAGDSATITVHAVRRDGFSGPIKLAMADEGSGFKFSGAVIAEKKDSVQIKLQAPSAATSQPARLHMDSSANIDGKDVKRSVIPCDNMMQAFAYWHLVPAQELLAVVQPPRPKVAGPGLVAGGGYLKLAATLTARFVAGQVALSGGSADKFVEEYVKARLNGFEAVRAAAAGGNMKEAAAAAGESAKNMRAFLESNLTPAQATKAIDMLGPLFGVLEHDVVALLELGVSEAKVQQTLPVLSKYVVVAKRQVFDLVNTGLLTRVDGAAKVHELRVWAVKELGVIVGEETARKWAEQPEIGMMVAAGKSANTDKPAPVKSPPVSTRPTTAPAKPLAKVANSN